MSASPTDDSDDGHPDDGHPDDGGRPISRFGALERIALVRHGETSGQSSIRYYGATDVPLSDLGREQLREARLQIDEHYELVAASPLSRAAEGARIVAPGRDVHLVEQFREIDFGHWEGLTAEEIAERHPDDYREWQEQGIAYDFPGGERRLDFQARVLRGFEELLAQGSPSILLVAHKGVVKTIARHLAGLEFASEEPRLGQVVKLLRSGPRAGFVLRA